MIDVAVVGGGISGLSAAWELTRAGTDFVLFEASGHLGGVIASRSANGFVMEAGPDAFLRQKPAALELCRELGLDEAVVGTLPPVAPARILHDRRLYPIPVGWRLIEPRRLGPMLGSPLIPWTAKLGLVWHWRGGSGPTVSTDEESVAAWLRRRYGRRAGRALAVMLAGPMLAGVYGGNVEEMNLASALPRPSGPVTEKPRGNSTVFASLRRGMGSLPATVAARLEAKRLRLNSAVVAVDALAHGFRLTMSSGEAIEAATLIVALPAPAAAKLLGPMDSRLGAALAAIPYGSSVNINLGFPQPVALPTGTGFLAPRGEGVQLLACTFAHQKFPGRAPANGSLLRLFYTDDVLDWTDDRIEMLARFELASILGIRIEPAEIRIQRWPHSMPQYTVGHEARVGEIESCERQHPGLALAGNAYHGVGVPDCIASGRNAARRLTALVRS